MCSPLFTVADVPHDIITSVSLTRQPVEQPGFTSQGGQVACTACPAGQECLDPQGDIVRDCVPGAYSLGAQSSCITCPAGSQCPVTTSPPVTCPVSQTFMRRSNRPFSCIVTPCSRGLWHFLESGLRLGTH